MIKDILEKENLNYDDIITLLEIDNKSEDFYALINKANKYSREHFNKGYVFIQIGLNLEPCSGNCKFCSIARDNFALPTAWSMTLTELRERLRNIPSFVSDVFLMTTADFDKDEFILFLKEARKILPSETRLVANFADFDDDFARRLKESNVDACYHIRRLREGIDTGIDVETREKTIKAIKDAGMELYYCIEPIGPEHTYPEIAREILFAKEQGVDVMACMRRVCVKEEDSSKNEISLLEITKIVAVSLLAVRPKKSMNVHEPNEMSMLAGVNQLYAEICGNPRDTILDTSLGRGINPYQAKKLLEESGWEV